MIDAFFSWITQALSAGLNILNEFVNSEITGGFFKLFLVVFAFTMVMKYVINPLIASGKSDQVKDSKRNKKDE